VINDGVAAIAAVLPTNEKQKGMILAQAAAYIRQLQENERINTNSWAEEKGMLEQDIADLRVRRAAGTSTSTDIPLVPAPAYASSTGARARPL
jgi:hypothetical protein